MKGGKCFRNILCNETTLNSKFHKGLSINNISRKGGRGGGGVSQKRIFANRGEGGGGVKEKLTISY
jgi:hypothetical protein